MQQNLVEKTIVAHLDKKFHTFCRSKWIHTTFTIARYILNTSIGKENSQNLPFRIIMRHRRQASSLGRLQLQHQSFALFCLKINCTAIIIFVVLILHFFNKLILNVSLPSIICSWFQLTFYGPLKLVNCNTEKLSFSYISLSLVVTKTPSFL